MHQDLGHMLEPLARREKKSMARLIRQPRLIRKNGKVVTVPEAGRIDRITAIGLPY